MLTRYQRFRGPDDATHKPLPELELMAAVLDDAIYVIRKYGHATKDHGRRLTDDALEWIDSNRRDWPFAFVNVCEVLNVNAAAVRVEVAALVAHRPAAAPGHVRHVRRVHRVTRAA